MAYGVPDWIFPPILPDAWLTWVKNKIDWVGLGFITLLFVIVFWGLLAAEASATNATLAFFQAFGLVGLFLFIFAWVVYLVALTVENLGIDRRIGRFTINAVLFGKIKSLKAYAFQLMVGSVVGVAFALPTLLPVNTFQVSGTSPVAPLENVLIACLFAVLEELWRVGTFEPLLGNFMRGGAEFPLLLVFFGLISFFLPTFLSVAFIGIFLIIAGIIMAMAIYLVPAVRSFFITTWWLQDAVIITVGVITWTLYHVYSASELANPGELYISALAFGFLVDFLDRIFQSIIVSLQAHITNNAIVTVHALRYNLYLALTAIIIFDAFTAIPVLIGLKLKE